MPDLLYKVSVSLLLVFIVQFLLESVWAQEGLSSRAEFLSEVLQKRYEDTEDIMAKFTQETYPPGTVEPVKASGTVYFKRPHQMRWEYEEPEKHIIVTQGKDVYIFEEEVNQVMILPREQFLSSQISQAFFFGKGRLGDFFQVMPTEPDRPLSRWTLKLIPKESSSQIRSLWITLDPKTHLIAEIWIEDTMGGKSHLKFFDMKRNQGIKGSLFKFSIPEDATVYRSGENLGGFSN